ncbi:MAG: phosphatase [Lachnospiraceae bacterium]|nr:phosphatase [Lachnospiraceae bacterium]MDY5742010.1 phosphatase [Lachnospiraceae bacterium]
MKLIADIHTHSLASGHAYSTIREMAYQAEKQGLELLGVSDHAPKMPGTCHEFYFYNLKSVDRRMCGIDLMMGAELNIISQDGRIDLPEHILQTLDYTIASLHTPCLTPGSRKENTYTLRAVMENPYVRIIGHPDDARYPVDMREVVQAAIHTGTILELNNASLSANGARKNARPIDEEMLRLCIEYGQPILVSSDAHIDSAVGCCDQALELLYAFSFPEELVINADRSRLDLFLQKKL